MLHLGTYLHGTPAAQELCVSPEDWAMHCEVIGGSGTGKTNFLYHLMTQRQPFCFIDAEGVSARAIADSVNCIYWRPRDYAYPVALNILEQTHPDERDTLTSEIMSLVWDVWDLGEVNAVLNLYLGAAVRLLLDSRDATLIDLYPALTDADFRALLLKRCKDRHTRDFWRTFDAQDPRFQNQQISSTVNKAATFARSLPLRLALGQPTSTLNVRQLMDKGTSLVVDLSGIGRQNARILGALIIFHFVNSASKRPEGSPLYSLIVDEFADFIAGTVPEALSKSRKRNLSLTLSHQYLGQLNEDVRAAIFANVGTFVCFRVGRGGCSGYGRCPRIPG
jgi:hypothetical protein